MLPRVVLRPASRRSRITNVLSKIGTTRISAAAAAAVPVPARATAVVAQAAMMPPIARLPQLPMNSFAGWRFHPRNPIRPPASATSTVTSAGPSSAANVAARPTAAIAVTPAARPSMLSRRLIALSRPPNQITASTTKAACKGDAPKPVIEMTKKAATASEFTIFASAESGA
jgi:hypothetical protein